MYLLVMILLVEYSIKSILFYGVKIKAYYCVSHISPMWGRALPPVYVLFTKFKYMILFKKNMSFVYLKYM